MTNSASARILAIGVAEVTWDLIRDPSFAASVPFLRQMEREGARGVTLATQPLVPEPLWATIATGRSPGGHGIFEALRFCSNAFVLIPQRFPGERGFQFAYSEKPLDCSANQNYIAPVPPTEGRFAIVTRCWAGMRWTLWRQAGSPAGRNVRSVRRSRVVLAPRPWRLSFPACAGEATVTTNAAHRGEYV